MRRFALMLAELTPEIGLRIAAFLALLGVFVFPGYWLGRRWLAPEKGWSIGQRWVLGFVISFGLFTALSAPFLLLRLRFEDALAATACVWSVLIAAAIVGRRSRRPDIGPASRAGPVAHRTQDSAAGAAQLAAPTWVFALAGCAMLAAVAFSQEWVDRRTVGTALLGLVGAVGAVVAWRVRRSRGAGSLGEEVASGGGGNAAGRRVYFSVAVALIVFAAGSAAVYSREDADDTLYLSEVLAFQYAERLHLEEPTHRGDDLPPNPVYWLASWELLGAILCRVSGLHPMIAFRTVLPPLVVLAAFALYARLLRIWLPRRLAEPALVVLAGYFLVGMGSHWTANNFLLPRAGQGKAVLIHVALPAVMLLLDRLLRRRRCPKGHEKGDVAQKRSVPFFAFERRARWLAVLAATTASMGLAACAMYLTAFVVGGMTVAYAWAMRRNPLRSLARSLTRPLALATLLPQVLFGVVVASRRHEVEQMTALVGPMNWVDQFLYRHLNVGQGGGTLELFALIALPLLVCLPLRRRGVAMLVGFPIVLALTAANPLLYRFVAGHVTTEMGYDRIFWLVPFGPIFAVVVGCLAAGGLGLRATGFGLRSARPKPLRLRAAVCSVVVAGLVLVPMFAGHYVWGAGNVYFGEPSPQLAANPYKMPPPLLPIARRLLGAAAAERNVELQASAGIQGPGEPSALPARGGRRGARGRILCSERTASFLAPLAYPLRFVYTRRYQTEAALLVAGRPDEARRRRVLATTFLEGAMPDVPAAAALREFDVAWVVTEDASRELREQLARLGYRLERASGSYGLWERGR